MDLYFNPISTKVTPNIIAKNDILILMIKEFKINKVINYKTVLDLEAIDDMPQSTSIEKEAFTKELTSLINRHSELSQQKQQQSLQNNNDDFINQNNDDHVIEAQPLKLIF